MGSVGTRNGRDLVKIMLNGIRGNEEWKAHSGNHFELDKRARGMKGI